MASSMTELVISENDFEELKVALLGEHVERCAILFANAVVRKNRPTRLLVREVELPAESDYSRRGPFEAELSPACVAWVTKRAKRAGMSVVFAHSHPGRTAPQFSTVDDAGERRLSEFLNRRHGRATHAALVVSEGGICARILGIKKYIQVVAVGDKCSILFDPTKKSGRIRRDYERQVRVFGRGGQESIEKLRVAIVGLGGIGSLVVQELAHLGVRNFVLIDPDSIERTNLNRVANASSADIGKTKASVAARYIKKVAPGAFVHKIVGDVSHKKVATAITATDFIFGCTDSHGSRAVLQQLSYQYFIPCIDTGVVINVEDNAVRHLYGRVQLLAPGLACFQCSGLLNAEEVRRDMMSEFERKQDPYIIGRREPAPAVMSFNGTVASLAITMFLAVVAGLPSKGRHLLYSALASSLRSVRTIPQPDCYICSKSGALCRGDGWPLFVRND